MANQEEAIEHSIDQLIALNMDDSDEVELTHRPANNVTLTDAERREKTSRRLTFGDYKTPAAAKAALNELNVQLQGIEATVERGLANSKGGEDEELNPVEEFWTDAARDNIGGERDKHSKDSPGSASDSDSDDLTELGKPIEMQGAVITTNTAGLPASIAMTPQAMLMGTIDLEELNPQFRQVGENNCRSIKQAADWFKANEPSTKENPNQLDKLKQAAKVGGIGAITEIQNTLTWLMGHKWNTTESHAMIMFILTEEAGKPGAGYADTMSQLIVMFSWMMPADRRRFKELTKQGKMNPEIGQITEGINKSKGFKWLDPSQSATHKGINIHHSHAWVGLLQAARNLMHRSHENTTVPRAAVSKWLSKHYKLTILGEEINYLD